MKICFKCGEEKEIESFYKHKGMSDGHLNKCKECAKKDVSTNYIKNIEHYKFYEKTRLSLPHRINARNEYAKSELGKIAFTRSRKAYQNRFPEKRAAHIAVGNAIRDGKLIKQNCKVCGSKDRIHAHHEDYSQPLNVKWLCFICHRAEH